MKVLIVGGGMIGKERIKALETLDVDYLLVDPLYSEISFAEGLTHNPDWIFLCTPHDVTVQLAKIAFRESFNVLCEKPLGRNIKEYKEIIQNKRSPNYRVGFNYRFYAGVSQLLEDCKEGLFGDLISVNMVLSLGDGPGSENSWRLDPLKSGEGVLLDPGIHLVDLALQISGGLTKLHQQGWSGFWDTGIVEESHVLAHDDNGTIYNIQSSVCHWRNTFRVEVNGTDGYGIVEGRNRYYGNNTYRTGKRWGWQSGMSQRDSEILVVDYDGEDSFLEETRAVLFGSSATIEDNYRCLQFIES